MSIAWSWSIFTNDCVAAVDGEKKEARTAQLLLSDHMGKKSPSRRIVLSLPFETIRMPNIISVFFSEFVVAHSVAVRLSPKLDGLIDWKSKNLSSQRKWSLAS